MPVQQEVPPGRRRYLGDERQRSGAPFRFVLRQQPRQDGRVVVNDSVGDQARALVTSFDRIRRVRSRFTMDRARKCYLLCGKELFGADQFSQELLCPDTLEWLR